MLGGVLGCYIQGGVTFKGAYVIIHSNIRYARIVLTNLVFCQSLHVDGMSF